MIGNLLEVRGMQRASSTARLQAINLHKQRGGRHVLNGVDVAVQAGEILTVLGANGAGKSTLIALLAGLLRPDTGCIRLDGIDVAQLGTRARARMGVALQRPGFSPRLTVEEILAFFSLCYHGNRPLPDLLKQFRLMHIRQRQIRHLSEGEQQRVSVALAFLKPFDLLLLDEPTAGFDAEARQRLWHDLAAARECGAAVICVTHLLREAQQWSDRVLVLDAGQALACDHPQALLERLKSREKVDITDLPEALESLLDQLPGVTEIIRTGRTVTLYCHSAREVMHVLLDQRHLPQVSCGTLGLEDAVRLLTRKTRRVV